MHALCTAIREGEEGQREGEGGPELERREGRGGGREGRGRRERREEEGGREGEERLH